MVVKEGAVRASKYIRSGHKERSIIAALSVFFFFSLFVMPQYFGLPLPLFDLTLLRISILLLSLVIFSDPDSRERFLALLFGSRLAKLVLPYLLVVGYTMVFRVDINAFLNPLIEIYTLFLLVYITKNVLGYKRILQYAVGFLYLLTILGIIEYGLGKSPFSFLETIKGTLTGAVVRSGSYRIMGPGVHSLAYGLILVAMFPLICYDTETKEVNLLKRKLLFLLVTVNVILTGSRSTLSVFIVEVILLIFMSARENRKRIFLFGGGMLVAALVLLLVFRNTGPGRYVMLQLTSIIDELLGTSYAAQYGAGEALSDSSNYRAQLKYIFTLDWLNPLIGIGRTRSFAAEINGSFIASVDSQYIAEYVRYAYPGLITYSVFQLYYLVSMFRDSRRAKDGIYKLLFTGALCYSINLLWVDSLQTFKYFYILIAVYVGLSGDRPSRSGGSKFIRDR